MGKRYAKREKYNSIDLTIYRLLISSQYCPSSVIKKLYPLLSGSRPIVVYSLSKENLLEAAWYMRNSKEFLNADITESSLRRYQVIKSETALMTLHSKGK